MEIYSPSRTVVNIKEKQSMISKRPAIALTFLLPALVLFCILTVYPLLQGLWLSLTDSHGGPTANFIGAVNYERLIADPNFWNAVRVTLTYTVIVVVFQNAIGLVFARALYSRPRGRRVLGVLILLPTLVAPLMASFIFSYLLAPNGAINSFLDALNLHALVHVWLGDPATALPAVAAVNIWMFAGYSATIFLAGYLAMPAELLEAASMDGAMGFRRFRSIEWPLLAPALTVNITLALIGSLKVFEYPLILTNGGPANATRTITMLIYRDSFLDPSSFGYSVAIAAALLVLVVVLGGLTSALLRARESRI